MDKISFRESLQYRKGSIVAAIGGTALMAIGISYGNTDPTHPSVIIDSLHLGFLSSGLENSILNRPDFDSTVGVFLGIIGGARLTLFSPHVTGKIPSRH